MTDMDKLVLDAISIAKDAGRLLTDMQSKAKTHTNKDIRDFSTDADIAAEKLICDFIKKKYPSHSILTEEERSIDQKSEYRWIIDPLDGTAHYMAGEPEYCTLVAVEKNDEVTVGVYYRPDGNETIVGVKGKQTVMNDRILSVSSIDTLSSAKILLHTTRWNLNQEYAIKCRNLYDALVSIGYQVFVYDYDMLNLNQIAYGSLDGFMRLTSGGGWWDVAPSLPIIRGAGGKVTDLTGSEVTSSNFKKGMIASNGLIHDELISLVEKYYR